MYRNEQIKARGWLWEKSEIKSAWNKCWCAGCNIISIMPSNVADLKRCPSCGRKMFKGEYVRKIKEDKTWK
ncbi:hypothetical protein ACHAL6_00660 [Proteiniclasticum sp. C24MP]|uniref:hypothetical protein n=1 Tax=Proteiniclasticum sp. C24MP TaxID=3374101 RepID=UPI003754163D